MRLEEADPKGLVRESYLIDGITPGECRSILMDWALSLPMGADLPDAIGTLMAAYAAAAPGHPMNKVLDDGLSHSPEPRRRGGRAARLLRD